MCLSAIKHNKMLCSECFIQKNIQQNYISTLMRYDQSNSDFRALLNEDQLKDPVTLHIIHAGKKQEITEKAISTLRECNSTQSSDPALLCFVLFRPCLPVPSGSDNSRRARSSADIVR